MPTVGKGTKKKRSFPYTPAGETAAQSYANKSGLPLTTKSKKKKPKKKSLPAFLKGM